MKAKRKEITELNIDELNIDTKNRLEILKVSEPAIREGGRKVKM